MYISVVQKSQV